MAAARWHRLIVGVVVACALAVPAAAQAGVGKVILRPTSTLADPNSQSPDYLYNQPSQVFAGQRAVVHYVTTGQDAPPLDDPNGNGVPEFVEFTSLSADLSITYYEGKGFKAILEDAAGPDTRPDVYIKFLGPGLAGVAIAPFAAEGGSFLIVQPDLVHGTAGTVQGSLEATIAHELFHVVQYSYIPNGELPRWFAEGSASAMEFLVYPEIFDSSTSGFIDKWLRETDRPIFDERFGCERCYGGALWWFLLARDDPGFMPDYLGRLYGYQQNGVALGFGLQPLDEIFKARGQGSLYDAFTKLSVGLYTSGLIPTPTYRIKARPQLRETEVLAVEGLSMHYVPIGVPSHARGVGIGVVSGGGPKPDVTLIVGGPNGRKIKPRAILRGRGLIFEVNFRNARERKNVVLIVTSGRKNGVLYKVVHQSG